MRLDDTYVSIEAINLRMTEIMTFADLDLKCVEKLEINYVLQRVHVFKYFK
jgi:hypothetical protein